MEFLAVVIAFLFGAVFASFTTVISERIYTGQSWFSGRSRCNSCRRTLVLLDLIPIVSWLFSRGKCRTCKARITAIYTLGELALGSLFVCSYLYFGLVPVLAPFLLFLVVLFFTVLYDLRHTVVPLGSSVSLIVLAGGIAVFQQGVTEALFYTVIVAALIAGGFFLLYYFSKGRAMGLGDTPVAFALSLVVGAQAIPGLLFSFWIGAVVGVGILVLRRGGPKMGIEVPFVPFLAAGFLLALFTQWNPLLWP